MTAPDTDPAEPLGVTAADEGDGYIVVRKGGAYVGEVSSTRHETGDWYDDPIVFYRWHASAVIVQPDGTREMVPAPGTFPSHARAIAWVARTAL